MRRQRLLENNFEDNKFSKIIFVISILIFLSFLFSFLKPKFLKFNKLEKEVLFAGISTFLIELFIILYLFFNFPSHFIFLFKKSFKHFYRGILLYFISIPFLSLLVSFSFLIFRKFGFQPVPQKIVFLYLKIRSIPVLISLFFLSVFVAPFFEEIIFRGFLYPTFKERFSIPFSIITTSLIFSFFHQEIFVFIGIFTLGLILTYIFEKTENIWICIGLHFSNNLFANLIIFIIKYKGFNNLNF